jgi:membrane protein YdbS with pleckstrin-like domain
LSAADPPEEPAPEVAPRRPALSSGPQLLPPEARWLFHARYVASLFLGLGPTSLLAVFALSFVIGGRSALAIGGALLLAELLYTLWWPSLSYERFSWELRNDALIVSQGVLWRDRTAIPLTRVQHVDVRQGPLEQWMQLARVHVHTASGVGGDGVVPGLRIPDAERLRDELVARAGGDDGV